MSSRAADKLAKMLARLNPASPQFPGRPAAKGAKADSDGHATAQSYNLRRTHFGGALSPTRCGASTQQTRSVRLDGESPQDLAASLSAGYSGLTDPLTRDLVILVAVPGWSLDPDILAGRLLSVLDDHIALRKWDVTPPQRNAICAGVIEELLRADACYHCGSTGHVLGKDADGKPGWVSCKFCHGLGRTVSGIEKRAAQVGLSAHHYRIGQARNAYEWLYLHCNHLLQGAAEAISKARGGREA